MNFQLVTQSLSDISEKTQTVIFVLPKKGHSNGAYVLAELVLM